MGDWQPVVQAKFTASRAEWEARDNINAGVAQTTPQSAPGYFLATGGDTKRVAELGAALPALTRTAAPKPPADLPPEIFTTSAGAVPR